MITVSAIVLTAGLVAEATGGRLAAGSPTASSPSVSTDTRTIRPGALFIALRGDRFDGHAFVEQAVAGGAGGVVLSAMPAANVGERALILVPDTLRALQDLARAVRRQAGARVVAITGSAGKTTTKEVTAELPGDALPGVSQSRQPQQSRRAAVYHSSSSSRPDLAVVELGMNHEGEIRTLVRHCRARRPCVDERGRRASRSFRIARGLARAKAEILEGATADTLVVSNADDPLVSAHVHRSPARHVTFGLSRGTRPSALSTSRIAGSMARQPTCGRRTDRCG